MKKLTNNWLKILVPVYDDPDTFALYRKYGMAEDYKTKYCISDI